MIKTKLRKSFSLKSTATTNVMKKYERNKREEINKRIQNLDSSFPSQRQTEDELVEK
jgi:hypothetical protein